MPMPAPRLAAVGRASTPSQQTYARRYGRARTVPKWGRDAQRGWQESARAYARFNGPAATNALVVSDMCARCTRFVEEQNEEGDWVETVQPDLKNVLDDYRNKWQNATDLVRAHGWRYSVDGGGYACVWDGEYGVEYGIFSAARVDNRDVRMAEDGSATGNVIVQLVEGGRPEEHTAMLIPVEQVYRFWQPDNEELLLSSSPMMASIEDLHRYRALSRFAWRTAESRLAMDGLLYVPSMLEAEGPLPEEDGPVDEQLGEPQNALEAHYYELARLSFENNDDITAIAPPWISYDREAGKPEWVEVGRGLDEQGIAHRKEAIEDSARPWPVPTTALMGGGVGDANHWSEWLASDKFVDSGIRPIMDRICHMDLTETFLYRRLLYRGTPTTELRRYRVGYDPTPIIVKQDRSDVAIKVHAVGGISYDALRDATGFEPDDAPPPEDVDMLLEVLSKGAAGAAPPGPGGAPLPAGPATVDQAPPTRPTEPPAANGNGAAPTPRQVAAVLASALASMHDGN